MIYLVRHGETAWSKSGQHTGRTDIGLTEEGERRAIALGALLAGLKGRVFTSPLIRARETCRLAGLGDRAMVEPGLMEWDYGVYEGRRTLDIRQTDPQWSIWLSPIPGGESLEQVAERARAVLAKLPEDEDSLLFAHGHILRVLAACWIGQPPGFGRYLALDTASISTLGYERQTRVIRSWNRTAG